MPHHGLFQVHLCVRCSHHNWADQETGGAREAVQGSRLPCRCSSSRGSCAFLFLAAFLVFGADCSWVLFRCPSLSPMHLLRVMQASGVHPSVGAEVALVDASVMDAGSVVEVDRDLDAEGDIGVGAMHEDDEGCISPLGVGSGVGGAGAGSGGGGSGAAAASSPAASGVQSALSAHRADVSRLPNTAVRDKDGSMKCCVDVRELGAATCTVCAQHFVAGKAPMLHQLRGHVLSAAHCSRHRDVCTARPMASFYQVLDPTAAQRARDADWASSGREQRVADVVLGAAKVWCPGYWELEHKYVGWIGHPPFLVDDPQDRRREDDGGVNCGWVAEPHGRGTHTDPCFRCVPCSEDSYHPPPKGGQHDGRPVRCCGCTAIPELPAFRRLLRRDSERRDQGLVVRPSRGPDVAGGTVRMQHAELVTHANSQQTEIVRLRRSETRQTMASPEGRLQWLDRLSDKAKLEVSAQILIVALCCAA